MPNTYEHKHSVKQLQPDPVYPTSTIWRSGGSHGFWVSRRLDGTVAQAFRW